MDGRASSAERRLRRDWKRYGRATEAAPGEAGGKEEQGGPEQERQTELEEDAENESGGGENTADALDKRIPKLEEDAGKIGLERGLVIFEQRETDVSLGDRGNQPLILAVGFIHGFTGLCDVLLKCDRVAQFAFAVAL